MEKIVVVSTRDRYVSSPNLDIVVVGENGCLSLNLINLSDFLAGVKKFFVKEERYGYY